MSDQRRRSTHGCGKAVAAAKYARLMWKNSAQRAAAIYASLPSANNNQPGPRMNQCRRDAMRLLVILAASSRLGIVHSAQPANAKPMEEHMFWTIIEKSKAAAGLDLNRRPAALELILVSLSLDAMQAFQKQYEQQLLKANRWDLWGAAYVMNGGCSDDGFRYFRDWLISEGRQLFESALAAPDSLAAIPRREYFELELFGSAASKAFAKKGGGELDRDFKAELTQPQGKEWKESDLPKLFPKLASKYKLQ